MTDLGFLLARHGYDAVARDRTARGGADTYVSRLLGRRTVVLGDPDGARAFYDESLARRAGAVPPPLAWLLFGRGAVHGMDGTEHRDRKRLILDVLDPDRLDSLVDEVRGALVTRAGGWVGREVDLHRELVSVYGAATLHWAGLDVARREADLVSRRLAEIVDGFGFAGPAYVRGWRARRWAERWARTSVRDAREGRTSPPTGSALQMIAVTDLEEHEAAVELLNVLRPTVATAVYIVFVAHALDTNPSWRQRLADGDGSEDLAFVEEVRRHYPFFPAVTALVRKDFQWHGHRFPKGRRVLLDLYGTNHDPTVWRDPSRFDPERFLGAEPDPFAFVPQGGGDPAVHHRCPGEPISTSLMCVALDQLTRRMTYGPVHPADPVDFTRLPALPARGYRISDVAPRHSDTGDPRVGRTAPGRSRA